MKLKKPARIFVPEVASPTKLERIRECGADLVVTGERYADALAASEAWAADPGRSPFMPTIRSKPCSARVRWAWSSKSRSTTRQSCCGSWGRRTHWRHRRLVWLANQDYRRGTGGGADSHPSVRAGRPVDAEAGGIAADSLAPKRVGELMFPIAQAHVKSVLLVSDESIQEAQKALWKVLRVVAEPGGAAAFAALLSGRYRPEPGEGSACWYAAAIPQRLICSVVCGLRRLVLGRTLPWASSHGRLFRAFDFFGCRASESRATSTQIPTQNQTRRTEPVLAKSKGCPTPHLASNRPTAR